MPKKADGLIARDTERPRELDCGLADAPGVNVFAVGLGLNSIAFALNLGPPAEVGVCTLLGLVIPDCPPAGPVGGIRTSWRGNVMGTEFMPPFCCRMSARRWLSVPVAWRPGCAVWCILPA